MPDPAYRYNYAQSLTKSEFNDTIVTKFRKRKKTMRPSRYRVVFLQPQEELQVGLRPLHSSHHISLARDRVYFFGGVLPFFGGVLALSEAAGAGPAPGRPLYAPP